VEMGCYLWQTRAHTCASVGNTEIHTGGLQPERSKGEDDSRVCLWGLSGDKEDLFLSGGGRNFTERNANADRRATVRVDGG